MRVISENLGYREIERLGSFLEFVCNKGYIVEFINRQIDLGYEYIEFGYDLRYDEPYITTELGVKWYESDFEK